MTLDVNYWTYLGFGITFLFYGLDKTMELGNSKNKTIKAIKGALGPAMIALGLYILVTLILFGH